MLQIYPAENRHTADHGWLKSAFSFSFADYYDASNLSFGPLRVLNDDIVQPSRGFGAHPHREMEIVSIVLKGQLKHQDSTGTTATTTYGEIQRMSAGRGIVHSEMNPSSEEEVHFLQLWFEPKEFGIEPSYEHTRFSLDRMKNQLLPVVSHQSSPEVAYIHQDLTMYMSELEEGKSITFEQKTDRRTFVFVIEGELEVQGEKLKRRDSARIENETNLTLATNVGATFLLIDLP